VGAVPFAASNKKLAPEALFSYAVRALERRAHTEQELRDKLQRRAAATASVPETIERLKSIGYLNDQRTAESHAYARREFQRFGRRRVLTELQRRGVDFDVAKKTVEQAYSDVDEMDLIREHLRRKLSCNPDAQLKDQKQFAKVVRNLQGAGFTSGKIIEALGKVVAEPEWLDGLEERLAESAEAAADSSE
jgi:regulatory protein